jgi:uncharacterized membrane protein YfcA
LAIAGRDAAFIFVPLFYYLGVPLAEAVPTALLLNVVSLMFATVTYYRGGLINWRIGLPIVNRSNTPMIFFSWELDILVFIIFEPAM